MTNYDTTDIDTDTDIDIQAIKERARHPETWTVETLGRDIWVLLAVREEAAELLNEHNSIAIAALEIQDQALDVLVNSTASYSKMMKRKAELQDELLEVYQELDNLREALAELTDSVSRTEAISDEIYAAWKRAHTVLEKANNNDK